jgi:hypothetical protein
MHLPSNNILASYPRQVEIHRITRESQVRNINNRISSKVLIHPHFFDSANVLILVVVVYNARRKGKICQGEKESKQFPRNVICTRSTFFHVSSCFSRYETFYVP